MIPLSITIEGFISYHEAQTLDFRDSKLWVISGPNGAGKSAVFNAIYFVLFGPDRNQTYEDLINHQSDRAAVTFDFQVGDSVFRAYRTISYTRNHRSVETKRGAFRLFPDDPSKPPEPIDEAGRDSGFKDWLEREVGLNDKTFTASVLLKQGNIDRLLEMDTSERYKVLSDLIDLSGYAALEARAKSHEKECKSRKSLLEEQLIQIPEVSQERIDAEAAKAAEAGIAAGRLKEQVSRLTAVLQGATLWGSKTKTLGQKQEERRTYDAVLKKEPEISAGFARLQELGRALPALEQIGAYRSRLSQSEQARAGLQAKLESMTEPISRAEDRLRQAEKALGIRETEFNRLSAEKMSFLEELRLLDPIVAELKAIENLEKRCARLSDELERYPADLDEQSGRAQASLERAREAELNVVPLGNFRRSRSELKEAVARANQAHGKKQPAQEAFTQAQEEEKAWDGELRKARDEETSCLEARSQAVERHQATMKRAAGFQEVAGQPQCPYCGSDLDAEHLENERNRVEAAIKDAEARLKLADEHLAIAKAAVAADEKKLAQTRIDKDAKALQLSEVEREIAREDTHAASLFKSLLQAYRDIRKESPYTGLIAAAPPEDMEAWLKTEYPSAEQLAGLSGLANQRAAHYHQFADLDKLIRARDQRRSERKETVQEIEVRRANLPENSGGVVDRQRDLNASIGTVSQALSQAGSDYQQAKGERESATSELRRMRGDQTRLESDIRAESTRIQGYRDSLNEFLGALSLDWKSCAETLDQEGLKALKQEHASLAQYDELNERLRNAHQRMGALRQEISALEAEIETISPESRRSEGEVRVELESAMEAGETARQERDRALREAERLAESKTQKEELEAERRKAERQAYLYGLLAQSFGKSGIQRELMRQAEAEIVDTANEMLANLSGGRWKLRLRNAGGSDAALDMDVFDAKTGNGKPINISLASGSQVFRISISLALAIGYYVRRDSRRIQSVIIDEGFGSLDKTGREDTIEELRSLERHLEKIILVSHQEEFYEAFPNGYSIQIADGASRVSLRIQ